MKHRWLIVLNLVVVFSLLGIVLYTLMAPHKATHAQGAAQPGCWGQSCFKQDPTAMHCLTNVHFSPYKQPETLSDGTVIGYLSSVYSYDCNSNWTQAELTPFAVNQGWSLCTDIWTSDVQNHVEDVVYPDGISMDQTKQSYVPGVELKGCYGGATGWPTVSNMVDGTHVTETSFYLVDQHNKILKWYMASQ